MSSKLYFIALVPDKSLRNQVKNLKLEVREHFGAQHALKSPAHITLQMPFRREENMEAPITGQLHSFSLNQKSFTVQLDGFGAFPPRVLFINITNPEPIQRLHNDLMDLLLNSLSFSPGEILKNYNPHLTIATRDLSPAAFQAAWPRFKNREFQSSFNATKLSLLKHNGTNWEIYKEFPFRNNK